jgi:hypothetical protein
LPCLLALTLYAGETPPSARNDAWRVLGPGGGGAQYRPTISPHDPNRVLVSCDMTGIYLTKDGGVSWRMFNLLSSASFQLFDPVDANVIYVKTIGLWRSIDGGDTWNLVHPDPDLVAGAISVGDHGEVSLVPGGGLKDYPAGLRRLGQDLDPRRGPALRGAPDLHRPALASRGPHRLRDRSEGRFRARGRRLAAPSSRAATARRRDLTYTSAGGLLIFRRAPDLAGC